jgi:hypothetical protein
MSYLSAIAIGRVSYFCDMFDGQELPELTAATSSRARLSKQHQVDSEQIKALGMLLPIYSICLSSKWCVGRAGYAHILACFRDTRPLHVTFHVPVTEA